jgi:hypothetical protein
VRSAARRSLPLALAAACLAAGTAAAQDTARAAQPGTVTPAPVASPEASALTPAAAASPEAPALVPAVARGAEAESVPIPALLRPAGAARALAAGDTVRLRSSAGLYTGTVSRVTADTLFVTSAGRSDAVLRSDITEVHRLAGRSPRGGAMLRGGGVGLFAGAALGFAAGIAAGRVRCAPDDPGCTPSHDSKIRVALTADGAVIGSLLGVMTGPALRRARWERVDGRPAPAPSIGVAPAAGGGVAVAGTLRL